VILRVVFNVATGASSVPRSHATSRFEISSGTSFAGPGTLISSRLSSPTTLPSAGSFSVHVGEPSPLRCRTVMPSRASRRSAAS
jgi:hypothetical protein